MSTAFCTTASKLRVLFRPAALFAVSLLLPVAAPAQSQNLPQRMSEMNATNSLADVARPWHLKLSVTLMDAHGSPAQEGTIERWQAGEQSRTVITMGQSTARAYVYAGERYASTQGPAVPEIVYDLLSAVLSPGASKAEMDGAEPEMRTQKFGSKALDCVMLSRPMKPVIGRLPETVPLGLFATYCMEPQSNRLELSYSIGDPVVIRTSTGTFQDHVITVGVTMREEQAIVAQAKVSSLSTFEPSPEEFKPPADLKRVDGHAVLLSSRVHSGNKTGGSIPEYPASARIDHISGAVVLHAIIGPDGRIHRLTVLSAPSVALAGSALAAVRTWTYRPYLLDGEPTSVDTTITVNFNLTRG